MALPPGALQRLQELSQLGRHSRGGRGGRVRDGNVQSAAQPRESSNAARLRELQSAAQPRRSMAETRESRELNLRHGLELAAEKRKTVAARGSGAVTAAAWNKAAASTHREQAPGTWSAESCADNRTQLPEAIVRGAFETATTSGAHGVMLGRRVHKQTLKSNVVVCAEVIRWGQAREVARHVQGLVAACRAEGDGYIHACAAVGALYDSTQMEVLLSTEDEHTRYGRNERKFARGPSIVPVFAQVQSVCLPACGLGRRWESVASRITVQPMIVQSESGSGCAAAVLCFDPLRHILPLVSCLRYLLVSLQRDCAPYNLRADRILLLEWEKLLDAALSDLGDDEVQRRCTLLVCSQRCEGHVGALMLKTILYVSHLLNPLFCTAHLIRMGSYRDPFFRSTRKVLDDRVLVVREDPPPECRVFLHEFFLRTILRGGSSPEPHAGRSEARQRWVEANWATFNMVSGAFNGYCRADGKILVFVGARIATRGAVIESLMKAWEELCFARLPGVPAENKWTTVFPIFIWAMVLHLFQIGPDAWQRAFIGRAAFADDVPEVGDPDEIQRIQNGKRMRRANELWERPLPFLLRGLCLLMGVCPADRYIGHMLKDVGPVHFLDYSLRRTAAGLDQGGIYRQWGFDAEHEEKEPTLWDFCSRDLWLIRELETAYAVRLLGKPAPGGSWSDMAFLHEAVGTSRRGGPPSAALTDGLPEEEIVMSLRSTTLAGIAECEIRIRQEHDAFPTAMHAMVTPVPEGESRTLYREKAVRKFARARRCCLSPAFDERLHKPALVAVKAAGSHRVDFTSLIDVLDTLIVWLMTTKVATTIGEKLHKLHGDLSKMRGRKPRDAMSTLSGAVVAQTRQVWERAGFRM